MLKKSTYAALLLAVLGSSALRGEALGADYHLGPQDRLKISVHEWPDLSGDFFVAASGEVALPVVGSLPAAGRTPDELADEIERKLQERNGLPDKPDATVQIAEYRPFFILGDVQSPGSFPFRPGLTVLQAVSVGGGFFRYTDPGLLRLERDAIASRGDLSVLGRQVEQYQARRARLQAEVDGASSIAFPADLTKRGNEPNVAQLMREEELLFDSRRKTLDDQVGNLQRLIQLYQSEIESLQGQSTSVSRQVDLLNQELQGVAKLVDRGFARAPQALELERNVAALQRESREIDTYVLRARASISQAEQNILDLRSQRRNEIIADIQVAQAQIIEAGNRITTAQRLVFESEVSAPMERLQQDNTSRSLANYTITRRGTDGVVRDMPAEDATEVLPGDVVNVQRKMQEPSPLDNRRQSSAADEPGLSQAANVPR